MIFRQICDMSDSGLVVMDRAYRVAYWNRWMEARSSIAAERITGEPLFGFFPELENQRFLRGCISVFSFGNLYFISERLGGRLFPFKAVGSFAARFAHMHQRCTMGPIRGESGAIDHIYVSVQDVTEIVDYERRLIELSQRDGLTGAYNRRFLETRLSEEVERHSRYKRALSVVLFDVDHFKSINDGFGHIFGDHVLKELSMKAASSIRNTDMLARYGGEEFCCILPETNQQSAASFAERLRLEVAGLSVQHEKGDVNFTISLGVAGTDGCQASAEALLSHADKALYAAKRLGRNRVCVSGHGQVVL